MAKKQPAKPKPVSKAKAKGKTNAPEATLEKILGDVLYETPVPPGPPGFQGEAKQVEGELLDAEELGAKQTEGETPEGTQASPTPLAAAQERNLETGKIADPVTAGPAVSSVSGPTREETQADATRRWRNEGIGERVAEFRDRIREEYRVANPGCKRRDAHEHAWARAMAEFPPPGVEPIIEETVRPTVGQTEPPSIPVVSAPVSDDQGVSGLSDLPASWPELPANAQLQIEIAWVTANRLRVRDGTGVNLSKALSPAPSYSALSWLETSILFPAKFADISVKATAQQDDEREHIRREKMAIEEVRSILSEMLEAEG